MMANVGGLCDDSGVNLEMGGDHNEYFGRDPANDRVLAIETSADHR